MFLWLIFHIFTSTWHCVFGLWGSRALFTRNHITCMIYGTLVINVLGGWIALRQLVATPCKSHRCHYHHPHGLMEEADHSIACLLFESWSSFSMCDHFPTAEIFRRVFLSQELHSSRMFQFRVTICWRPSFKSTKKRRTYHYLAEYNFSLFHAWCSKSYTLSLLRVHRASFFQTQLKETLSNWTRRYTIFLNVT